LPSTTCGTQTAVHKLLVLLVLQTHHVRGSNYNLINVFEDRIPGRAIVLSGGAAASAALRRRAASWL
jgi:hypothetical protein